jgi:hypothetical protein
MEDEGVKAMCITVCVEEGETADWICGAVTDRVKTQSHLHGALEAVSGR